jgi:hypothetical protein
MMTTKKKIEKNEGGEEEGCRWLDETGEVEGEIRQGGWWEGDRWGDEWGVYMCKNECQLSILVTGDVKLF